MPRRKQKTASKKVPAVAKGATAVACGQHLTLSRQRISQMTDEGNLSRNADGSFDLDACRDAYIAWLRSEDRKGAKSAAASRVQDARAREMKIVQPRKRAGLSRLKT
jgi:hypothetical protein